MGLLSRRSNEMHHPPAGGVAGEYPPANNGMGPGPNNYEHGNVLNHADPNAQPGTTPQQQPPASPPKRGLFGGRNNHHDNMGAIGMANTGTGNTTHTGPAPMLNANTQTSPRTSRESGSSAGTGTQHTMIEEGKLRRKGKMENTMGTIFCNSNMKRKSEAHLAQADHLKMQASELGEAERLEAEAGMRRQRAVGLGADPAQATGQTGYAQRTGTTV